LRALGTAVIFAQSGLFVCATEATSSIRTAIFTHFSSAEDDFSDNDAAGRFEGEVKEIAEIIDAIEPHSLVLLNETFQTTAYREGAQGMKEILQIFPDIKCKYVFVTHMTAIFEIFPKDEATVLTANKFKLTQE
jgi:DNA mismatch repair ATPase MutS